MAEQATPPEVLAITFVLDSSLAVAAEWSRIIIDYIHPMMKRLTEVHPAAKPRMAFVTYGCADTLPSPILAKKFFLEPTVVTKEMRENPVNLGIGLTNGGAGRGMAALEGLVAAIEMFERLQKCLPTPPNRTPINHIFHLAGSPPDDSIHPEHNEIAAFDELTWKEIPEELKKRNIHYSTITISQNYSRYTELHSTTATPNSPKEPWFTVRPPHAVLLGGFPATQKAPIKRVGDAHPAERTPETKRQRLTEKSPKTVPTPRTPSTQTKPSPKVQPQPVPPPQAQVQAPPVPPVPEPVPVPVVQPPAQTIPPQPQPPQIPPQPPQMPPQPPQNLPPQFPPPQMQPPNNNGGTNRPFMLPANMNVQTVIANIRTMETELQRMAVAMQKAQQAGNQAIFEKLKEEFLKKNFTFQKGKQLLGHLSQRQQQQNNQQNNGGPSQPQNDLSAGQPQIPRQNSPIKPDGTPGPMGTPQPVHMGHGRTPSLSGNPMMNNPMSNVPPPQNQSPLIGRPPPNAMLTAQMQKIIEQRQRAQQGSPPGIPSNGMGMGNTQMSPNMGMMEAKPPSMMGGGPNMQPLQPPEQQQGPPMQMPVPQLPVPQAPQPHKQTPVWQGTLCWSGTAVTGKKEMLVHVVATTSNVNESRAETWPKQMTLVPLRDPAVPPNELQQWISRSKPVLCGMTPRHDIPDAKGNENIFKTLCGLLTQRNIYASAAWILPSGEHKNNVIFFPFKESLVGAFFPLQGVPEPPGQKQVPQQPPADFQRQLAAMTTGLNGQPALMPPELLARLQAMSPNSRARTLLNLKKAHTDQLQQAIMRQQGGQGGGGMMGGNLNNTTNNPALMNALMAMNMQQQQQQQQAAAHQAHQQQQQQQQQQSNHADLAFGGNVPNFGGGQMNFMNAMGGMGMNMGQPNMMGGAGMPRQMPQNMAMMGQMDPKIMQAFLQQRNNGGGGGMPG